MKNFLFTLLFSFAFLLLSCGISSELATQQEMTHLFVKEYPGISKDVIFEKSMKWIANNFKSAKQVIDYQDKQAGTIVAKGIFPSIDYGALKNGKLGFTLSIDVKENKARYTFDNLVPMAYDGTEYPQLSNRKDVHTIGQREFTTLVKQLSDYTNKAEDF